MSGGTEIYVLETQAAGRSRFIRAKSSWTLEQYKVNKWRDRRCDRFVRATVVATIAATVAATATLIGWRQETSLTPLKLHEYMNIRQGGYALAAVCASVRVAKYLSKLWTDFDNIFKEECLRATDKSISFCRGSPDSFVDSGSFSSILYH